MSHHSHNRRKGPTLSISMSESVSEGGSRERGGEIGEGAYIRRIEKTKRCPRRVRGGGVWSVVVACSF